MKIKKFLKKNEIYFNTVTSLLLGLMAIIVAYNSNMIAHEQKQMNYYENMPDFHISQEYKRDSIGSTKEIAVRIAKFGGKAKNVSLKIKTYAQFEFIDKHNKKTNKTIPLSGYFNESYRTGENKGDIRLLRGTDNKKKFAEFSRLINTEFLKKGYTYLSIDPIFIIKIKYADFLNNNKVEYYDVSSSDGVLIEKKDFRIELYENKDSSLEPFQITELNDDRIQSYLKTIIN